MTDKQFIEESKRLIKQAAETEISPFLDNEVYLELVEYYQCYNNLVGKFISRHADLIDYHFEVCYDTVKKSVYVEIYKIISIEDNYIMIDDEEDTVIWTDDEDDTELEDLLTGGIYEEDTELEELLADVLDSCSETEEPITIEIDEGELYEMLSGGIEDEYI